MYLTYFQWLERANGVLQSPLFSPTVPSFGLEFSLPAPSREG
jgi:hypothetical protein